MSNPTLREKLLLVLAQFDTWETEIEVALLHANSSHTVDDLVSMVLNGQLTMTTHEESFSITSIQISPQHKCLHFMIVGGNLEEILSLHNLYAETAKANGCKYMTFSGRKGWLPTLRRRGWKHQFTTMSIEV